MKSKDDYIKYIYDSVDRNLKQRSDQIILEFKRLPPAEIFDICFQIIIDPERDILKKMPDQVFVSRILTKIKIPCPFDPRKIIKTILNYYELSVEEIPFYFYEVLGFDKLKEIICEIEKDPLSDKEKRALKTFKYWLEVKNEIKK